VPQVSSDGFYKGNTDKKIPNKVAKMTKIKVALAGVGNCASAFIQGLRYYNKIAENSVGLRNPILGEYKPSDIQVVAAFDVDNRKVGKDLADAIFATPNNTPKVIEVPMANVIVQKAPTLDGISKSAEAIIQPSELPDVNVEQTLREAGAEILLNLLPSGATNASFYYAEQALTAKCAFINATPTYVASDAVWARKFENAQLPIAGDDLVDQVGSTALHKTLLRLLSNNGVKITETYQLDVGGGAESLDSHYRGRMRKRGVKSEAISQDLPYDAPLVAGSSDFVDFMDNARDSYFYINGRQFGGAPIKIDIRMEVTDGPNAGPILMDAIRGTKLALKRGLAGSLESISAYGFKMPPTPTTMYRAERWVEEFLLGKRKY